MKGFNVFGYDVKTEYTQKLAEYAAQVKYEDLPPEVIERVKFITLHTIGCSLAAAKMDLSQSAEKIAKLIGGASGDITSWVSGEKMSGSAAAFVNGTLADMLDWEDCSYTGHPSASLVPAAVAVGEETKADGKTYMEAFVAGYEVYQRIALAVGWPRMSLDPKYGHGLANWPIFAASVAAGKYYGFDAELMNKVIGMSILFHKQISNLEQATMSDAYHYEYGWDTQGGMQAALCVREGVSNLMDSLDIPYTYFEHQFPNEPAVKEANYQWLNKDLGSRYLLMELLIKHWPTNMWIQTPVEIAHDLVRDEKIDIDKIADIMVNPPVNYRMHFRPEGYDSLMDAEFSIPYCIAASLIEDMPGPNWYTEENLKSPRLLNLASKVHGGDEPCRMDVFYRFYITDGKEFPTRTIKITMEDGTVYERKQELHKGHPSMMMTKEEFHKLFMHQCSFAISPEKAEGLFNYIMDLENAKDISDIGQFFGA